MARIDEIIKKHMSPEPINEASAVGDGGTSLINWTFWNKPSPMIYVRDEKVLYSASWEFPTGSEMSTETREHAKIRGYIILDW